MAALLLAPVAAQPIPIYKSQEDYCYHNPQMPTCADGKPIDMEKALRPMTDPMGDWCDKNPTQPVCQDRNRPRGQTSSTAAPARRAAPVSRVPASGASSLPVPSAYPTTSRTRRAGVDIRLGELDWRLVQAQPDILIGINMAGLLESELARSLLKQWMGKLGAAAEEQDKVLASLADTSEMVISVRQRNVLAAMVGRLERFPERAQFGPMQCARVSPDTVLLGTGDTVYWAFHRLKLPPMPSDVLNQARDVARSYDFWAFGRPQGLAALGQQAGGSTAVRTLTFGVSFRDQFRFDLMMQAVDPTSAARLREAMSKDAPRGMQSVVEGDSVRFTLILDRDAALQRLAGFMSDSMGKQFAPLLSAARQIAAKRAAEPARSAPGKIVIDGLDDGPREVSPGAKQ